MLMLMCDSAPTRRRMVQRTRTHGKLWTVDWIRMRILGFVSSPVQYKSWWFPREHFIQGRALTPPSTVFLFQVRVLVVVVVVASSMIPSSSIDDRGTIPLA